MKKLMSAEAKLIDLVDYLSALGRGPQKVRDSDYWYLSHLRTEKTPSFKVNRTRNIWKLIEVIRHLKFKYNRRYVRVYATERAIPFGYSLIEFEVYGK